MGKKIEDLPTYEEVSLRPSRLPPIGGQSADSSLFGNGYPEEGYK